MMYLQTSDSSKQVKLALCGRPDGDDWHGAPVNSDEWYAEVVDAEVPGHAFNLVNNMRSAHLTEARRVAKEAGLKLRQPGTMAVR